VKEGDELEREGMNEGRMEEGGCRGTNEDEAERMKEDNDGE
jgi:hypothetical protein